jgi:hypothetical protein
MSGLRSRGSAADAEVDTATVNCAPYTATRVIGEHDRNRPLPGTTETASRFIMNLSP